MPAYSIKEMGQTVNLLSCDSPGSLPGAGTIFYKIILDILFNLCYNSIIEREKRMIEIRECKYHGLTRHRFCPGDGNRWRCIKCSSESIQRKRYRLKEKAVEYKGGKCEICGYDKCIDALEFHHKDPYQKDFGISAKGVLRKWDIVKEELDKCICVCANCHREIHYLKKIERKNEILSHKGSNEYSDEITLKIKKMKDLEHKSFYQIAKELNISRNTVMRHYKK